MTPNQRAAAIVAVPVVLVAIVVAAFLVSGRREGTPNDLALHEASAGATPSSLGKAPYGAASGAASQLTVASSAPPAAAGSEVAPFIDVQWGSGLDQLGRGLANESNPEAPMSFAFDEKGSAFVLDQVNGRIVRYGRDGKPIKAVRVPLQAAQDIAVAPDGSMVVLDRLADKQIAILDPDGKPRGSLSVEGQGVEEGGAVTGVFVDGKDVYVEREHNELVHVGDTSGIASTTRKEIPGRPTRDGKSYIYAWLDDPRSDSAFVASNTRDPLDHRFTRQIRLPFTVMSIHLLDTDRAGIIYFAVSGPVPGQPETSPPLLHLLCLEPTAGAIIGEVALPPNTMPEETFRELAVLDGGGVVYSLRSERGVRMMPADCRPPP